MIVFPGAAHAMALASHLLFGLGIAAWTRTARATKADEPKWYTAQRQAEASHAAPTMPLNFVHIMKTGGSSIQDLLTNMFPSFFGQFGTAGEHATTRLPIFTNCTSFAGDERANVSKKSCGCVSGHAPPFNRAQQALGPLRPASHRFCILRDPVERLMSALFYVKSFHQPLKACPSKEEFGRYVTRALLSAGSAPRGSGPFPGRSAFGCIFTPTSEYVAEPFVWAPPGKAYDNVASALGNSRGDAANAIRRHGLNHSSAVANGFCDIVVRYEAMHEQLPLLLDWAGIGQGDAVRRTLARTRIRTINRSKNGTGTRVTASDCSLALPDRVYARVRRFYRDDFARFGFLRNSSS